MNHLVKAILVVLTALTAADALRSTAEGAGPERVSLWNNRAPLGDGEFEEHDSWITVYRSAVDTAAAIVICPGGGYGGLAIEPEGHGIARWLNRHGITGVVLEYRLPAGRSHDLRCSQLVGPFAGSDMPPPISRHDRPVVG